MATETLTDIDLRLLDQLAADPKPTTELKRVLDSSEAEVDDEEAEETADERLAVLVDHGLVRRAEGGYALTASGRRARTAHGSLEQGTEVDRPAVDRELATHEIEVGCRAAVGAAYDFVSYWGDATPSELRDAVFFEQPAGYDDRHRWYDECVEPALGSLSAVEPPTSTDSVAQGTLPVWVYKGEPEVEEEADGRAVLGSTTGQPFGNARQAIEAHSDSPAGRQALRRAFAQIESQRSVTVDQLEEAISASRDQDTEADIGMTDVVDGLRAIPSVRQQSDGETMVWQYHHESW